MNFKNAIQKILSVVFLLSAGHTVYGNPLIKNYCDAMKQLSRQGSMVYTAVSYYPDKSQQTVSGKIAMQNGMYYDSSNVRFVFMNAKWLLVAEHPSRMLNIIYLPDWKKKMGKGMELDISGYLLNNADPEDFSSFKVIPQGTDSFEVHIKYNIEDGQAFDLKLHYMAGGLLPVRYEGTIFYHFNDDDAADVSDPATTVKVVFECHDIRTTVAPALFNDSRLIRTGPGKAQLKRYNNYKIYKKNV